LPIAMIAPFVSLPFALINRHNRQK
jgi:hypothetical protein